MAKADREQLVKKVTPTNDQIVLHLDMDCFFAACERLRRPELEGEPVVIGGGFDKEPPRGAVATASYEAREYGVESAQPMKIALDRLPRRESIDDPDAGGYYLKGEHEFYKEVSQEVMSIAETYAGTLRRISIDEAYLDVTQVTSWDTIEVYAKELKMEIQESVGVTASIGVAPTMSCAKVASEYNKPDGICIVRPGDVKAFLSPLSIGEIHGVGPVSEDAFKKAGVETAGDLASLTTQQAADRFGSNAITLHERVRGIDTREVEPVGKPKSISKEKSIDATTNIGTKRAIIQQLASKVNKRVASKSVRYRTIGIKVVETPFEVNTREYSLHGPVQDPLLLEEIALELLIEFEAGEVRKLGVRVSNLDFFDGEQIRFDDWDPPPSIIADRKSKHCKRTDDQRSISGQTTLPDFR